MRFSMNDLRWNMCEICKNLTNIEWAIGPRVSYDNDCAWCYSLCTTASHFSVKNKFVIYINSHFRHKRSALHAA